MNGDEKCETCQNAKTRCSCSSSSTTTAKAIQSSMKPPDLFVVKEDLNLYERRLKRWSRACGIDPKLQGDVILLHPSVNNPALHDRLDRELGDKLQDNENAVEDILKALKQWFGVDKGVDLMKTFNEFANKSRRPDQDLHQYVADFEDSYNKLEKLGEKLSSRLLALFLLKNANLSDTDFQIITSTLDFSSEDKAKSLFEDTKDSLNKHQNCRAINSKPATEKTFFIDQSLLDSLPEEQQQELVLWLKKKRGGDGDNTENPNKKWRKCHYCLCKCLPKWKRCECECSKHPHWRCPQKPPKKADGGDTDKEPSATHFCTSLGKNLNAGKTFVASENSAANSKEKSELNFQNLNKFLGGDIKKIPSAKPKSKDGDVVCISHQLTFLTNKKSDRKEMERSHIMTVDTAAPTSLCGAKLFKALYNSYPASVSSQFQAEPSSKRFQFGGGETTSSLGRYTFPVHLMDDKNQLHAVNIAMEVVECDIIMLLGGNSLINGAALIDIGNGKLTLPKIFGPDIGFPINYTDSGHWTLNFFASSKQEGKHIARCFLVEKEWSSESASAVVNYVQRNVNPKFRDVVNNVYLTRRAKGKKAVKRSNSDVLTQRCINKLHHFFGHAHPKKLETLIRTAGRWDESIKPMLEKLSSCEPCAIEGRRVPKPKVALPKASNHNHVVSADLKENTRYPQSPPYILYLVDCFSRFKVAVFIPDKKSSTITEAIMLNWVKMFGPMKYLHVDRGREWMNKELQSFCHKFDIRLTATAAMTPNANGICERQHAVVDRMMDKMLTADRELSPEIALCWSIYAANALEMNEGISPFVIVFGKAPMHPTLMNFKPGNEENLEVSNTVASNIRAMLKAREVFASLESDRVLRKALQERIYSKSDQVQGGDWIYYRNNSSSIWKGPVKVTTREGKRIYVLSGGRLNTINLDDILLCKSDENMWLPNEEYVTAPKPKVTENNMEEEVDNNKLKAVPKEVENLEFFTYSTAPTQSQPQELEEPSQQNEIVDDNDEEEVVEIEEGIEHVAPHPPTEPYPPPAPAAQNPATYRVTCNSCSKNLSNRSIVVHAKKMHGLRGHVDTLSTPVPASAPSPPPVPGPPPAAAPVVPEETPAATSATDPAADTPTDPATGSSPPQQNQVFFTSETEAVEPDEVYLTMIPKSRHNEEESVKAKETELSNFKTFDVYEEVSRPKAGNLISTQWVIVDKQKEDGSIVRKARLCMRGDTEKNKHLIPVDSPTVNKITLKLMLTIAKSKGWEIRCSDVSRAFLQTDEISREVLVIPPKEAKVSFGKVWKLKRAAYGLIDASRGFFLNHSSKLQKLGFEALQMDPATFILKENDNLKAISAAHVDDTITVAKKTKSEEIQNYMSKHFKYGESKNPPCRYLGNNISIDEEEVTINQDHYISSLEVADTSEISHLKRDDILPDKQQSTFRSLASKLNMLAMSARPDLMYDTKVLTTKYGSATKRDIFKANKIVKRVKEEETILTLPDIGDIEDWILVGVTDASNKSVSQLFAVGGYVIMLVNKTTSRAAVLTWSSKKIDRVCSSSLAAETLSLQKLAGNMFFVRHMLKQMFGEKADNIPGLALTDNQDLFSCVHNLKPCEDKRLLADIISIKQAIADDKTITELRYVPKEKMIADCLTKSGKLGDDLWQIVKTGVYHIPGGVKIRDSTKLNIKTWQQLMKAEN